MVPGGYCFLVSVLALAVAAAKHLDEPVEEVEAAGEDAVYAHLKESWGLLLALVVVLWCHHVVDDDGLLGRLGFRLVGVLLVHFWFLSMLVGF